MAVTVSSALLLNLMRETVVAPMQPRCGILRGRGARVLRADWVANVAAEPHGTTLIDPRTLAQAEQSAVRKGSLEVLGYYHSSHGGGSSPEPWLALAAPRDGRLWLILSRTEARFWRARANGALFDRFDPEPMDLFIGKRAPMRTAGVRLRSGGLDLQVTVEPPPL